MGNVLAKTTPNYNSISSTNTGGKNNKISFAPNSSNNSSGGGGGSSNNVHNSEGYKNDYSFVNRNTIEHDYNSNDNSNNENENTFKCKNPGTVEDLHKECRELMPAFFEGGRLNLNNLLSNHFQLSHIIKLSPNGLDNSYHLGTTYVGTKRRGNYESYPILFGEIGMNGNMQASIIHSLTEKLRMKFGAEYHGKRLVGTQHVTDYFGDSFTASAIIANPNLLNGSGVFVGQYLQSITLNLALGSELAVHCGVPYHDGVITLFNFLAKYTGKESVFSTSLGASGLHLTYMKEASSQLKIGVEFNTNFDAQSTYTTLGYQVNLPKADLLFRASMDTNWNLCSVLEKNLKPLPFVFTLSALMNQSTGKLKLGCGLAVG